MFRKKICIAAGGAALVAAFLATHVALAHSRPIRFDPPPGAVLNAPPAQVTGWFTQPLRRDPNWNYLQVADGQGNRVDTGEPALSPDRKQMSVALRSGLGPGRYLVSWRTWDDGDGAIFGDCFAFFVGQAAADASVGSNARLDGGAGCQRIDVSGREGTPAPGQTPTAPPEDDEHEAVGASGDDSDVPVWALIGGVAAGIVAGGVGGRMLRGRS